MRSVVGFEKMHSVDGKYFMKRLLKTSVAALLSTALMFACGGEVSVTNPTPLYSVTYNGNNNTGGSVPVDSTNYQQGQIVTVLGNTGNLVKTNYTFAGWNTQANGSGTTYTQGQAFPMGTANVTLYAMWTANQTYTITYNGNNNTGGSVPVDSTNYQQGQIVTVLGNTGNLVKTNYSFVGWNTRANGSGTTYTQGQAFLMGTANVTLYAVWTPGSWIWVSGSSSRNQPGVYGTQGVAAGSNVPGSRYSAISWIDGSGNFWLFGGFGLDSAGNLGNLNDLWKFDGTNWTWVSGSDTDNQSGVYGTSGVPAGSNVPGSRYSAISWIDGIGNLWLFGGNGLDSAGSGGYLNDLWKFDGTNWTWMSGSVSRNQAGVYGTQGLAAGSNVPGAREGAVSWIDGIGNLWLCGGAGYDSAGNVGNLNDLWKFDGTNWTWVSGSDTDNQSGVYGTSGVPAGSNVPGSRYGAISWIDGSGNLWLFGGNGYDSAGSGGYLNDLWKFDGTNWTWVSGSNIVYQSGVYGTPGAAAGSNVPGSRYSAISWIDGSGNLWLFGGDGYDSAGNGGYLNDLWKFDGTNWTWMNGSNIVDQSGIYGTQGAAGSHAPGSRYSAISWIDGSGNLWLFGGYGYDSAGNLGYLNDLWEFQP